MTDYKKPWWIWAIQLPVLDTTLQESHQPALQQLTLTGKPVWQSLHWVTAGPLLAVAVAVTLTLIAWGLGIKNQSTVVKLLLVGLLCVLPLIAWGVGGGLLGRISRNRLAALADEAVNRVIITVDPTNRTIQVNRQPAIDFADVYEIKLVSDRGVRYVSDQEIFGLMNLVMDTAVGQVMILPQELGTLQQKLQVYNQLKTMLR